MHVGKNGIKPNIFTHVATRGCSVQRESRATPLELTSFLVSFLKAGDNRTWYGVLVAKCKDIREIKLKLSTRRGLCVYDTSERHNPAHAEMFQSHAWADNGDANEMRALLWAAFNNGIPIPPEEYYSGTIWSAVSSELGSS